MTNEKPTKKSIVDLVDFKVAQSTDPIEILNSFPLTFKPDIRLIRFSVCCPKSKDWQPLTPSCYVKILYPPNPEVAENKLRSFKLFWNTNYRYIRHDDGRIVLKTYDLQKNDKSISE